MRYLLLIILLAGCGGSDNATETLQPEAKPKVYLVAGQSNAVICDWSVFEAWTGATVINIGIAAKSIDQLISLFEPASIEGYNFDAVIFIHGESDSVLQTWPPYYVERVEHYRAVLGVQGIPFLVSSVGYTVDPWEDYLFDPIRAVQRDTWDIVFDDAHLFRDQGMLVDTIHFSQAACELIFESIVNK